MSETLEVLNSKVMNDERAKWVADGLEIVVGVLGVLEQEHPKHEQFATASAGTDGAYKSRASSGTGGQALAIRLLGIHSAGASADIRIPQL